eukprot:CAMPEP_0196580412 /NCGR_PEP_ID=MMETSP1081-20130531/28616_1 /TAXON_ID=36882 /ORGANISM="Pyramimonas amylifera, Strain CCMP720" /LENGTH=33 /DNA_ID= /DNA_START= /DNA_END= /DNA_ORIENTATION=
MASWNSEEVTVEDFYEELPVEDSTSGGMMSSFW